MAQFLADRAAAEDRGPPAAGVLGSRSARLRDRPLARGFGLVGKDLIHDAKDRVDGKGCVRLP